MRAILSVRQRCVHHCSGQSTHPQLPCLTRHKILRPSTFIAQFTQWIFAERVLLCIKISNVQCLGGSLSIYMFAGSFLHGWGRFGGGGSDQLIQVPWDEVSAIFLSSVITCPLRLCAGWRKYRVIPASQGGAFLVFEACLVSCSKSILRSPLLVAKIYSHVTPPWD